MNHIYNNLDKSLIRNHMQNFTFSSVISIHSEILMTSYCYSSINFWRQDLEEKENTTFMIVSHFVKFVGNETILYKASKKHRKKILAFNIKIIISIQRPPCLHCLFSFFFNVFKVQYDIFLTVRQLITADRYTG